MRITRVGGLMVRPRRERSEVVMDILRAALGGAKKTRIGQRANVNPQSFKRVFPELLEGGLIARHRNPDGDDLYRTTERGKVLLKMGEAFYALLLKRSPRPP